MVPDETVMPAADNEPNRSATAEATRAKPEPGAPGSPEYALAAKNAKAAEWRAIKQEAFLASMRATGSTLGAVCKSIGLPYTTFCTWRREDPSFAEAVLEAEREGLDVLKHKMLQFGVGTDKTPGDWRALDRYLTARDKEWGTTHVKSESKVDATVESGPATLAASDSLAARLGELAVALGSAAAGGSSGGAHVGDAGQVLPILRAIDRPAGGADGPGEGGGERPVLSPAGATSSAPPADL